MKLSILILIATFATMNVQAQKQDPWMEYIMPAEVHEMLKTYTGDFTMEITMWMAANQEPQVVTVQSSNKMILGGRFLEMTQTGNMMGMNYNSITTIGFNNSDKSLALTTLTNMGTGILSLTGSWDEKAKVGQLTGKLTNPVTKNPIQVRQTIGFPDNDTILIENYDQEEGTNERKSIQYKFIRTKG
jgi:hypothetical protein